MVKKLKNEKFSVIFEGIRQGKSLYEACCEGNITTKDFYLQLVKNAELKEEYRLAGADYADKCTDEIRNIALALKAGQIDNSTAKLLIETTKWLAQKFCPEPVFIKGDETDDDVKTTEIVVKFV